MDDVERLLRLLALNDEESVTKVLASDHARALSPPLSLKVDLLVRLGALLALGAATTSLRATVDGARAAGATEAEIADVLVAVAPDGKTAYVTAALCELPGLCGGAGLLVFDTATGKLLSRVPLSQQSGDVAVIASAAVAVRLDLAQAQ